MTRDEAYNLIDRRLRAVYDDEAYAELSAALDLCFTDIDLHQQLFTVQRTWLSPDTYETLMQERKETLQQLVGLSNRVKEECAAICYGHNWYVHGADLSAMILATKEPE